MTKPPFRLGQRVKCKSASGNLHHMKCGKEPWRIIGARFICGEWRYDAQPECMVPVVHKGGNTQLLTEFSGPATCFEPWK